jgi:transcription antitermination factor NusG
LIAFNSNPQLTASMPVEAVSQQWFAAHTGSCQEKRVAQHLSARNIEFFLPVYRSVSCWKNGLRVTIERPMFPGYVFVKIERSARIRVVELPGVRSIVGAGREPIPLPREEIEALRQGLHLFNAEPHPYLNVGDRATICTGPLAGITGIVVRKRNGYRFVLSVDLIMKSVSVEVDGRVLERFPPLASIRNFDSRSATRQDRSDVGR